MNEVNAMSKTITITNEDILQQVKLSGKIPEIIEEVTKQKILKNAADEIGLQIDEQELQKVADKFRLANQLQTVDNTYNWLKKQGLSLEDFENMLYQELISAKLQAHLFSGKLNSYFMENQLKYIEVILYEVIFEDEDLAMELFFSIQEGEISFYDVAHQYIQDQELRRKGGYCGRLTRQNLKPEISSAVFASNPPQLLKPIITSKGVHLILVEEIIQPQLNEEIGRQILSEMFDQWIQQQKNQTSIDMAFLNKS